MPGVGQSNSHGLQRVHDPTPEALEAAHLKFQSCSRRDLVRIEIECGREFDPRVSEKDIEHIMALRSESQQRFAANFTARQIDGGRNILFGPTARVVDHIVDHIGVGLLLQKLCSDGHAAELRHALEHGPGEGKIVWDTPTTPVELMASLVRWATLREGDKTRIRVSDELRSWMYQALHAQDFDTQPRLGGVTAVGALLGGALGHNVQMFALGSMPKGVLPHLPQSLPVIHEDLKYTQVKDLPVDPNGVGNFCISFMGQKIKAPAELSNLLMNGGVRNIGDVSHLDVFITGSSAPAGFGSLDVNRVNDFGAHNDLMVLTGLQVLGNQAEINSFFDNVEAIQRQGCLVAAIYSNTRFAELEAQVWKTIRDRQCVTFLGLSSVEAFEILERVQATIGTGNPLGISDEQAMRLESALAIGRDNEIIWENGRENPLWVYRSAAVLQEITGIPLVRVRGKAIDTLVVDEAVKVSDPRAVRASLFASRDLGTLKVANKSGLIDEPHEVNVIKNVPFGYYIAAHRLVSDLLDSDLRLKGLESTQELQQHCFAKMADGRTLFAIPPCPFFERAGGTQSAGDTIDITFVSEQIDGLLKDALSSVTLP